MNEKLVSGTNVVNASQKIAGLMQLLQFLYAAEQGVGKTVGIQVKLELMDPHRTTLWINSKLILRELRDQAMTLSHGIQELGVDISDLQQQLEQRLEAMYPQEQQSN